MIKITNLHKYYNKGKKNEQHVLNDVSLEFERTGLVCILGESGSGKTTLLNTMGGLDTFSGGSIQINDTVLTKYDPKVMEPVRNDHFDYIFQNYYLLKDYSVAYNIKLALNRYNISDEEKEERVDYVLNTLGMSKYKKKLVSKLSGGQQQRVSIARALVKSPDVIFADEPTGNLDEENTIRTMSILKNISKECLVILVTHEKRIAHFFADRIIEVCDGRVVRDEINTGSNSYERSDDSNIYLKEMTAETLENEHGSFCIYSEKESVPEKIKLTLAWKNGKLYIQNNMPFDILMEGVENGVRMLDEERPKLDMNDIDEFSYELPTLESKGKSHLPPKEIVRMAIENIQLMGKKQAFVIGILLVTAVLLSITLAEFINTVTLDESAIVASDTHYVQLDFTKQSSRLSNDEHWEVMNFVRENLTDDTYGKVFYVPPCNVNLTGQGYAQMDNLTQSITNYSFTSIENLSEEQLIYGRMPKKRYEVVMDKQMIEHLAATNGSVSSLHDSAESYLGMRMTSATSSADLIVVGISDTKQTCLYIAQSILIGMNTKGYEIASIPELQAEIPDKYKDLALDTDELLMREGLYNALGGKDEEVIIGDDTDHVYKIKGTFPDTFAADYVLSDEGCENIRNLMIFENTTCLIYSDDPDASLKKLEQLAGDYAHAFRLDLSIPAKDQIAAYKEAHSVNVGAKQLITAAIVIISLIMMYFTIKSNAVSRSEELTVYRLIGISRSSILKAYMLEMFIMTSYTSLPAVLITSGVIRFISSIPSLEISLIFPWWSILLLLAGIYAVHILISILPVYGILSKPPATLAIKE